MEKEVSAHLTVFADSLAPSEEFIKDGKRLVEAVFKSLEARKGLDISRRIYGGSVGKKTSVIHPDFDCCVFLNEKGPPFDDVLKEFKSIIEEDAKELQVSIEDGNPRRSAMAVSFKFLSGVKMDLLPVSNLATDKFQQWKEVLGKIATEPEKFKMYESSLVEIQVDFMKKQDGFTHQLIRLSKYWFKSLALKEAVYGGSAVIELICVAVRQEQPDNSVLLDAFRNVLLKIIQLGSVKIAFKRTSLDEKEGKWGLVSENELQRSKEYFSPEILKRPCFIIEPANPYHDYATNFTAAVKFQLRKCAEDMIQRLADLESRTDSPKIQQKLKEVSEDGKEITKIYFDRLFQPFPMYDGISQEYPEIKDLMTTAKVMYNSSFQYNAGLPKIMERKEVVGVNADKAKKIVKILERNLEATLRNLVTPSPTAFTNGLPNVTSLKDVKDGVEGLLSRNFQNLRSCTTGVEQEKADVTLYMPYRADSMMYAVQICLFWK